MLLWLMLACGGPQTTAPAAPEVPVAVEEPAEAPAVAPVAEPLPESVNGTCLVNTDCPSGICEGLGCDDSHFGTCAPAQRACTRDLMAYCGCDGKTFYGSGSCPNQRFAAKGPCAVAAP